MAFSVIANSSTGFSISLSASATGQIKVWNGVAWVVKPVRVWNGVAWVVKPVKRWNGVAWVIAPY